MQFSLDAYAALDSPIHRWDTRYKMVGLLSLMFAFAFVSEFALLPLMLAVTCGYYLLARLPFSYWSTRLRYPGLFLLVVLVILPIISGETILWQLGPLALRQEGLLAALLIASRFVAILTVGIVLFGTAPFLTTVNAMYALGLPALLNDMLLFFYRYLHDFADMLTTMQTASRLRGFQASRLSWHTLSTLAALTGTLLVRSYEQSERVYQAMRLRGYGYAPRPRVRQLFRAKTTDRLALGATVLLAGVFIGLNIVLGGVL